MALVVAAVGVGMFLEYQTYENITVKATYKIEAVSYTHLDVYKRQHPHLSGVRLFKYEANREDV